MKVEKDWVFPSWVPKPKDVYEKNNALIIVSNVIRRKKRETEKDKRLIRM